MECLFRFYSYGLEKSFSGDLYRDFEDLTLKDYNATTPPRLYGLEKVNTVLSRQQCGNHSCASVISSGIVQQHVGLSLQHES